ncbi:MAG: glycosyltransferase family 2 protein [Phycisphaeraceae bacterium]
MSNQPDTAPASRLDGDTATAVDVSVIVPMLNEQESIVPLYREMCEVAAGESLRYEMIFIDDGSGDETVPLLHEAAQGDPRVTIIQFTRRFGQTAALAAGFGRARGSVIVPLDADGQNDPHDIPRLVAKLDEPPGWDIVSGWRRQRHDKLLSRRLPSRIANRLVRRLTWTQEIHDFGCSLKAYRAEVLEDVHLYGEMHRFLPAICKWRGARVTEQEVNHRARAAGTSKYGLKRTFKVLLDLLTVKFLGDYLTKPIYFFGKVALLAMVVSLFSLGLAVVQKLGVLTEHGQAVNLNDSVFVLFAMMTFLMSVMFVMMGVLSELLVRIYHESQGRAPYRVRKVIHGTDAALAEDRRAVGGR